MLSRQAASRARATTTRRGGAGAERRETRTLSVLLVRRAEREGDPWSGHMALPGGHEHADDRDLLHTARRETLEEVGLDLRAAPSCSASWTTSSPMRSSDLAVRPFVFWLAEPPELDALAGGRRDALGRRSRTWPATTLRATREVEVAATRLDVPAFVIGERVVWGMTFHLLERLSGANPGRAVAAWRPAPGSARARAMQPSRHRRER